MNIFMTLGAFNIHKMEVYLRMELKVLKLLTRRLLAGLNLWAANVLDLA
jgi:hypothetical protein